MTHLTSLSSEVRKLLNELKDQNSYNNKTIIIWDQSYTIDNWSWENNKPNITIDKNPITDVNYQIIGFATNPDLSGQIYSSIDDLNEEQSLILYPVWRIAIPDFINNYPSGLWFSDETRVSSDGIIDIEHASQPNVVLTTGGLFHKVKLHVQNKPIYVGSDWQILFHYTIARDNFGYFKYFNIYEPIDDLQEKQSTEPVLTCYIKKQIDGEDVYFVPDGYSYLTIDTVHLNMLRRRMLDADPKVPCVQLNIRCDMQMVQVNGNPSITGKGNSSQWEAFMTANLGYYQTSIALTFSEVIDLLEHKETSVPDYVLGASENKTVNLLQPENLKKYLNKIENPTIEDLKYPKLHTDFWKHGQAGIIDIQEKIKPCKWYGKQHPFEFEVVFGNQVPILKQFVSIELFSNNVIPESIHYTLSGDQYGFFRDKRNMYIRQEATKAFYQQNGSDILYDHRAFESDFYEKVGTVQSETYIEKQDDMFLRHTVAVSKKYRATMFPLVYSRNDTFNEIEDYYRKANSKYYNYDYPNLTGGEVNYNWREDSFTITNHVKSRDIQTVGRSRGNMDFKNGRWLIQISPLRIYQHNEDWTDLPPLSIGNAPVPRDMLPVKLEYAPDDTIRINDKSALEQLNTDGSDPDLLAMYQTKIDDGYDSTWSDSLENYLPSDVYKAGYKNTSYLDVTTWPEYYGSSSEAKIIDNILQVKVRYSGEKLVLIKGIQISYEPRV